MPEKTLVPIPRKESETANLLRPGASTKAHPDVIIEVNPGGQERVSLGDFTASNPPKGFSLEIAPDYDPETVVAQITRLGVEFDKYELVLHVANYGDKTLNVEVAQL